MIIRGSNLTLPDVKRVIIIPDERKSFLIKRLQEPMLKINTLKYGWSFLTYSYLDKKYDSIKKIDDLVTDIIKFKKEKTVQITLS